MNIKSLYEDPNLLDLFQELIYRSWSEIGTLDNVGCDYWFDLMEKYPEYQFGFFKDNHLIAVGNCVPIFEDVSLNDLPDEGWRWAILQSIKNYPGNNPKYVSALSATIDKSHRGKQLAQNILQQFKDVARHQGCSHLIAPVRPSKKYQYPLIPMEDYILWKREDGTSFDSWLRIHEGIGGKVLRVSKNAMIAEWSIGKWKEFYPDLQIPSSGYYLVDDALNPIHMDLEKDVGTYNEDGVWVYHEL